MEMGSGTRRWRAGFTLVELMVAMALSVALLLSVLRIFDANRQSARWQRAFAEVQESGRIAMALISRDVRAADYWGCAPGTPSIVSHINAKPGSWMDFANAKSVDGKNDVKNEFIGTKSVKEGSDVLILRGSYQPHNAELVFPYTSPDTSVIHIAPGIDLKQGEVIMIADCAGGDIFVNTLANTKRSGRLGHSTAEQKEGIDNTDSALSRTYTVGARIVVPFERIYFIGENAEGGWSLYRRDNGVTSELVNNVDDLQLFFGTDQDEDGAVDSLGTAANAELDKVLSIRAQISAYSTEKVARGEALRRHYTATANIRNRSL